MKLHWFRFSFSNKAKYFKSVKYIFLYSKKLISKKYAKKLLTISLQSSSVTWKGKLHVIFRLRMTYKHGFIRPVFINLSGFHKWFGDCSLFLNLKHRENHVFMFKNLTKFFKTKTGWAFRLTCFNWSFILMTVNNKGKYTLRVYTGRKAPTF